jgi:hypothetical protein
MEVPENVLLVIEFCKSVNKPLTSKTISKNLGIRHKYVKASLYEAKKYFDKNLVVTLRNELNARRKRPIWNYVSV